jgi:Flp pilus assembly protein TadD
MAMQTENAMQKWLDGQISLGTAASWDTSEIRIISEIAYALAQQGRAREAIVLFEGLVALAPATAYFQAALGALCLRLKNFPRAIEHLDAALKIEPNDVVSLVNRGEAKLRAGNVEAARVDLEKAALKGLQTVSKQVDINDEVTLSVKRARALLQVHQA